MGRFLRHVSELFIVDFGSREERDEFAAIMADAGMVSEESVERGHPADLAFAFVRWRTSDVVEPRPAWLRFKGERRL